MTSSTANDDPKVSRQKFGATIYKTAKERAETPEGKEELSPWGAEQFLDTLKQFTDVIDKLPETYNIHSLYLALNYLGGMIVETMEHNKQLLMRQTGGNA